MRRMLALAAVALALAGCAHKKPKRAALPKPVRIGYTETGIASWYGPPYHGRQAADGETYDMETMVAAHKTLPFQTWVRVYNLTNNKTVDVRIIDRGPFVAGRIIDLSHAAARAIDLIGPGIVKVRIEVIRPPDNAAPLAGFGVQVGIFRDRAAAERMCAKMAAEYGSARLVMREGARNPWRVVVGNEPTEDAAETLAERIRQKSGENNAFVVRLDSQ